MTENGLLQLVSRAGSKCYRPWYLRRKAQRLSQTNGLNKDADACCDALWSSDFRPFQKRSEALGLFNVVKGRQPQAICEIGAAGGGTAFLFTRAAVSNSILISVDIGFDYSRRLAIRQFAQQEQKVFCLQENSQTAETVRTVGSLLKDRQLDILFIDGDHSYEGVSKDFSLYSPLVRQGGLIIFHDIVPDFRLRYGTETLAYSGGVPQFWQELKLRYSHEEIVEDPDQDGYGIGLIHWPGSSLAGMPELEQ